MSREADETLDVHSLIAIAEALEAQVVGNEERVSALVEIAEDEANYIGTHEAFVRLAAGFLRAAAVQGELRSLNGVGYRRSDFAFVSAAVGESYSIRGEFVVETHFDFLQLERYFWDRMSGTSGRPVQVDRFSEPPLAELSNIKGKLDVERLVSIAEGLESLVAGSEDYVGVGVETGPSDAFFVGSRRGYVKLAAGLLRAATVQTMPQFLGGVAVRSAQFTADASSGGFIYAIYGEAVVETDTDREQVERYFWSRWPSR